MNIKQVFSERFEQLRKQSGMNQKQVADAIQVSQGTIKRYKDADILEKGNLPDAEMLCRIADLFHVSIDYLLGRENLPADDKPFSTADDIVKTIEKMEKSVPIWFDTAHAKVKVFDWDETIAADAPGEEGYLVIKINNNAVAAYFRERERWQTAFTNTPALATRRELIESALHEEAAAVHLDEKKGE